MAQITLSCVSECDEISASSTRRMLAMVHIQAPQFISDERASRAPIAVSAVVDRSGSMDGVKLRLVKKTLKFVIQSLKAEDQLGIVAYDDNVTENLPMSHMDPEGRQRAIAAVESISIGGMTNLSGGLFGGLDQLQGNPVCPPPQGGSTSEPTEILPLPVSSASRAAVADITSVWLFTDGQANAGIQNSSEIKAALETRLSAMNKACSVFTFGFGNDHNSQLLTDISSAGSGMYYYIETEDKIPDAFTDCLGGLLSVSAQNLNLSIEPHSCCTIQKVITGYQHTLENNAASVRLSDIYSEEERDILLEVEVSAVDSPYSDARAVFDCKLEYFNVISCQQECVVATCLLARPEEAHPSAIPLDLDRQRNRIRCADALAQAKALAEKEELQKGRDLLQKMMEDIKSSVSASHHCCQDLLTDLQDCLGRMVDRHSYGTTGCHTMSNTMNSHYMQRSCGTGTRCYQTSFKATTNAQYYEDEE